MSDINDYSIKGLKAHHFTGPTSTTDNEFQTIPGLLRAIADWMETEGIEDPEFDNLRIVTSFEKERENFGDPFHETATLYFLEQDKKKEVKTQ